MTRRGALCLAAFLLATSLSSVRAVDDGQASDDRLRVAMGKALFARGWVGAPASTAAADGLGPLYAARSCAACHGPGPQASERGLVVRLSDGSGGGDPVYGRAIQTHAVPGTAAEARLVRDVAEETVRLADGAVVTLRRPRVTLEALAYGPLAQGIARSPRQAPDLRGAGLLEALPEAAILALADPDDADGDGVSGRPNRVPDGRGGRTLGRFGSKAAMPDLAAQNAAAMAEDIGMASLLRPEPWGDCTAAETACRTGPHGAPDVVSTVEAAPEIMALILAFTRLGMPLPAVAPRGSEALAGSRVFEAIGCAACHHPSFRTAVDAPEPALRDRPVRPYTDLLLHDLGEALADGVREGEAAGAEWRTAPLWGLAGRPSAAHLHDGRARDATEAVLWHGGEAAGSRDRFAALPTPARAALLIFLESL